MLFVLRISGMDTNCMFLAWPLQWWIQLSSIVRGGGWHEWTGEGKGTQSENVRER